MLYGRGGEWAHMKDLFDMTVYVDCSVEESKERVVGRKVRI